MSGCARIMVTLETDPTRYHGERGSPPQLPGSAGCEQILAHLVTDLERIFPSIRDFSVAMPGALYDQTQVLRPGYPVLAALEHALETAGRSSPVALALDINASAEANGIQAPDPAIPPGLLQNLPLVVTGRADELEEISEAMEHRFLEEGQLSAHSARALETHFGIAVRHARFMTLTDLRALLKLQLEHFGFLGLWALLDAALEGASEPLSARGRCGQQFEFAKGEVTSRFESFDYWAQCGGGQAIEGVEALANGYVEWTREYRQYITTLQAHQVPLSQRPASPECSNVKGDYLIEESAARSPVAGSAEVTEHGTDDVGVVAVSIIDSGRQLNFYPLTARGLDTLHQSIRSRGLGPAGFSFPGRIVLDPHGRRLLPDNTRD